MYCVEQSCRTIWQPASVSVQNNNYPGTARCENLRVKVFSFGGYFSGAVAELTLRPYVHTNMCVCILYIYIYIQAYIHFLRTQRRSASPGGSEHAALRHGTSDSVLSIYPSIYIYIHTYSTARVPCTNSPTRCENKPLYPSPWSLRAASCIYAKPVFGLWRLTSFCISVFKPELLLTELMQCCCEKL